MVLSLNKAMLIGNVGKDPEIRVTQDGKELATFPLATTETWRDKNSGEKKEKTEWHRIVVFVPALVNIIKNYVHKGTKLFVEGSLQTREWNDQPGTKKYTTEVILQSFTGTLMILSSKKDQKDSSFITSQTSEQSSNGAESKQSDDNQYEVEEEIDDEIPF